MAYDRLLRDREVNGFNEAPPVKRGKYDQRPFTCGKVSKLQ